MYYWRRGPSVSGTVSAPTGQMMGIPDVLIVSLPWGPEPQSPIRQAAVLCCCLGRAEHFAPIRSSIPIHPGSARLVDTTNCCSPPRCPTLLRHDRSCSPCCCCSLSCFAARRGAAGGIRGVRGWKPKREYANMWSLLSSRLGRSERRTWAKAFPYA